MKPNKVKARSRKPMKRSCENCAHSYIECGIVDCDLSEMVDIPDDCNLDGDCVCDLWEGEIYEA